MSRAINMVGRKYGKLTVIKRTLPNNKWNMPRWLCKCDCGTEKIIVGWCLRNGDIRSCGCLYRLSSGVGNMREVMGNYKRKAKRQGLKFDITEEKFKELTQKNCYYCGAKPNNIYKDRGFYEEYIYNGIDRIDNSKGYEIDNIVPCCKTCNYAKNILTIQEFRNWIERIYNKMFPMEGR